ncbi:MAG: DUF4382 domain-containing protein [Burkholderiaceae bacterium]
MRKNSVRHWFAVLGLTMFLAACGGGQGGSATAQAGAGATGTLNVALTDAPASYAAVNVTVQKVRVRRDATAGSADAGWHEVVLDPARRIDLLGLANGQTLDLGSIELPQGRYTQIRLVLAANGGGSAAMANTVELADGLGTEHALHTPSGQQSGLKVKGEFEVIAGQPTGIVLDFDAQRSVVRAGNSGRYNLKPVITALQVAAQSRLEIAGELGIADARVSAQIVDGSGQVQVLKATVSDANGSYKLAPLPASANGLYTVVIDAPGYRTHVIREVPVLQGTPTQMPAVSLTAAAAPDRHELSGVVTVPPGYEDSLVEVLVERIVDGIPVRIAQGNAAQQTFDHAVSVAREVPIVATYDGGPMIFAEPLDVAAAQPYQVHARDGEAALTGNPVTVAQPANAGEALTGVDLQLSIP